MDVGGGSSVLVDRLLDAGFERLAVLDVSETALSRSRDRLGDRARRVDWIAADVTEVDLPASFDVWHDRAVFHFLTAAEARRKYVARLRAALAPGGTAVIATFGPAGPTHCSGLPVCRYDAQGLLEELGPGFRLDRSETADHTTPHGTTQQFVYASFERA